MGSPSSMFMLPMYIGMIFSVFCLIIVLVFTFTDIKDDQRFGIKVMIYYINYYYSKYFQIYKSYFHNNYIINWTNIISNKKKKKKKKKKNIKKKKKKKKKKNLV